MGIRRKKKNGWQDRNWTNARIAVSARGDGHAAHLLRVVDINAYVRGCAAAFTRAAHCTPHRAGEERQTSSVSRRGDIAAQSVHRFEWIGRARRASPGFAHRCVLRLSTDMRRGADARRGAARYRRRCAALYPLSVQHLFSAYAGSL
jgi:hypothetical protein